MSVTSFSSHGLCFGYFNASTCNDDNLGNVFNFTG